MIFYIVIYLFLLISCVFRNKYINKCLTFFFIFLFAFICAIRDHIGTDFENYILYYDLSPFINEFFKADFLAEPSFWLLCSFCKTFSLGSVGLFFFSSIISSLVVLKVSNKIIPKYFLPVLLVFYVLFLGRFQFNTIRHGLMVVFVWWAFLYINERSLYKFSILIIISFSFHIIGILFFPFYWLLNKEVNEKRMFLFLVSAFLIGRYVPVFDILLKILPVTSVFFEKTLFYTTDYYSDKSPELGYTFGLLFNVMLLFVCVYKRKYFIQYRHFNTLINSLFIGIFLFLLFNKFGIFVERFTSCFYLSLIFLIPMFLIVIPQKKDTKIFFYAIFVLYTFFILYKNYTATELNGAYQFIPFKTIF
jgi:hypothetical protein